MGIAKKILDNFLILGLLTVITLALIFPGPGAAAGAWRSHGVGATSIAVFIIFILSGLCLDSVAAAYQPKALSLGTVLVLFVTPLLAIPILYIDHNQDNVNLPLLQGMALFTVVPTTLSSGVTMVTQANGNVSLAILLTSITNCIGVFTMPFAVTKIFAADVQLHPKDLLFELIWLTLVPLGIGLGIKECSAGLKALAKKHKKRMSLCQNSCILAVVWVMTSGAQGEIMSTSTHDLCICLSLAAGVHLVYRLVGYAAATAARLEAAEWVTVVLMCSQKSLPVCVSVLTALPAALQSERGLLIVPCIMAHASQLVIDSILAVRWQVPETGEAPKPPDVEAPPSTSSSRMVRGREPLGAEEPLLKA